MKMFRLGMSDVICILRRRVELPMGTSWTAWTQWTGAEGDVMAGREPLIPKHGGYRNLKSFQVAQLAYDLTVRFCERYVDRFSRTRDQMVQAARSGVQNIAEGSQASGTSRKTELKLTNVARASLEELRLDYEDFLRQRDHIVHSVHHLPRNCCQCRPGSHCRGLQPA